MTKIEWANKTWNPTTGCTRVSPGCKNCYMFSLYPRLRAMGTKGYERAPDVVTMLPERLDQPYFWSPKKRYRVFVNSMSDLFHRDITEEYLDEVFGVMTANKQHDFLVLTKRPHRARAYEESFLWNRYGTWPPNVWLGVSVETQQYAWRIEELLKTSAAVRFLSAEPLLGFIDLYPYEGLDWVIAGGESGPRARPCETGWLRSLRKQSIAIGAAFFLKQLGGFPDKRGGEKALLDGELYQEFPNA